MLARPTKNNSSKISMKIIITGATKGIGRAIAEKLQVKLQPLGFHRNLRAPDISTESQWYRAAREKRANGMDGRKSECAIVPMKWGNSPGGPHRGKGAPSHGIAGGKDDEDTEPR